MVRLRPARPIFAGSIFVLARRPVHGLLGLRRSARGPRSLRRRAHYPGLPGLHGGRHAEWRALRKGDRNRGRLSTPAFSGDRPRRRKPGHRPPGQGHIVVLSGTAEEPTQEPDARLAQRWTDLEPVSAGHEGPPVRQLPFVDLTAVPDLDDEYSKFAIAHFVDD